MHTPSSSTATHFDSISEAVRTQIERPIFLVGALRSGTTLLTLMLDHHPEIAFPGEFDLAVDFPVAQPTQLSGYHDWLESNRFFLHHELQIDPALDYPQLVRSFLAQMWYRDGDGKTQIGAAVHRHYRRLLSLWPEARFVHIRRDPRDVAPSWVKMGWYGNTWSAAKAWGEVEQEWLDVRESIPQEQRYEVSFERLIEDARGELQRLCYFLGVEYSDTMLEYPENSTYGEVDPSEAGKWKARSPLETQRTEAALGGLLKEAGYESSEHSPLRVGALARVALAVDNLVGRNRFDIQRFGFSLWLSDKLSRWLGQRAWQKRTQLRMHEITERYLK